MLYREIIAVCSQIHTKHINTLCGQNVELLNVKLAVQGFKRGVPNMEIWQFEKKNYCAFFPCTGSHCLASRLVPEQIYIPHRFKMANSFRHGAKGRFPTCSNSSTGTVARGCVCVCVCVGAVQHRGRHWTRTANTFCGTD